LLNVRPTPKFERKLGHFLTLLRTSLGSRNEIPVKNYVHTT